MHTLELISFLSELSENNSRSWFAMNEPRYAILREEFIALVAEVIADISRFDPAVTHCDAKKTVFRFHRDLRFSADRSPYKTNFSSAITASGLRRPCQGGGPAYYFHIDAQGQLLTSAGEFGPPPARLRAIRQQLVDDAAGFTSVLAQPGLQAVFGDLYRGNSLQRLPKGFTVDLPHPDYLKLKSFVVRHKQPLDATNAPQLRSILTEHFQAAHAFVAWLRQVRSG